MEKRHLSSVSPTIIQGWRPVLSRELSESPTPHTAWPLLDGQQSLASQLRLQTACNTNVVLRSHPSEHTTSGWWLRPAAPKPGQSHPVNARKAPTPDVISSWILKTCVDQLAEVYTTIFNLWPASSQPPLSNPRTKNTVSCLNYFCQVALISIIIKCFETHHLSHKICRLCWPWPTSICLLSKQVNRGCSNHSSLPNAYSSEPKEDICKDAVYGL